MNECPRSEFHDLNLASRKIEEAAWRRYDAVQWLESEVGPLGIPKRPSEREFICCLRNGLTLCNAINKILPGAVPKVVDNDVPSQSLSRDSQPLHAYQYFENVRNFLVAVEELKLPAFEASDLERDTLETGSGAKVVDCILALKSYQELKQISTAKSPLVKHFACATRIHSGAVATFPSDACRHLDLSATLEKEPLLEDDYQKPKAEIGELIVKLLVDYMVDAKENINGNLADSLLNGHLDPVKPFRGIMAGCFEEQIQMKFPEDLLKERSSLPSYSTSTSSDDLSAPKSSKCCRVCSDKGTCSYRQHFQMQEKELLNLKALKLKIKNEFEGWQSQYQRDMYDLGSQVQELSTAAVGYHRVMNENRNLYNMVQDLKGNIRVYCRIRPSFSAESQNVIDFIGEDGSLVILDPSKLQKDSRKVFHFNQIFGPTATQDEVFKDTQPLIRSVVDGYNVCIFAYGQTGSGKTHTMSGPSGGSSKDMGINYLALNDLFQMSNQRKGTTDYDIYVQMVEIYNEQVRDLLADEKTNHKYPL